MSPGIFVSPFIIYLPPVGFFFTQALPSSRKDDHQGLWAFILIITSIGQGLLSPVVPAEIFDGISLTWSHMALPEPTHVARMECSDCPGLA